MQDFKDKRLLCIECKNCFTFTAVEQDRYMKIGLKVPKRCAKCREAKKERYKKKQRNFLSELNDREIKVEECVNLKIISA
jgi:hypothetical protein